MIGRKKHHRLNPGTACYGRHPVMLVCSAAILGVTWCPEKRTKEIVGPALRYAGPFFFHCLKNGFQDRLDSSVMPLPCENGVPSDR